MEGKQMNDMMKELLVTGLNNYEWGSLSAPQLLMIVRIIDALESIKKAATEVPPVSEFHIADTRARVS